MTAAAVPDKVAVRVAVLLADTVAVEMLNVPDVAFGATVTDDGAVNVGDPLFNSATTVPGASAAFDSVTVQAALPLEPRAAAVQVSPVRVGGVCSAIVAIAAVPFNAAVSVAV